MQREIDVLLKRLRAFEDQWEQRAAARQAAFRYRVERGRVVFEETVARRHQQLRMGVLRFLRTSPLSALVTAPVLYAGIVPLALLDLFVTVFQRVCFPFWGILRVRRAAYIAVDRHHLRYLNAIEKLNCLYCGYATGLIALCREVAGRTEQYWCPIKHARRIRPPHGRYRDFLDYGDGDGYRDGLESHRDALRKAPPEDGE
ncbi:MAG: hypothetical protein HZA24_05985 [Nitrospirae bacterium]|nr:hypothetical protein [Nitrospirota bacterium]